MPIRNWRRRRVSDEKLLALTRHLGAMLGAGIPIITALKISADRCGERVPTHLRSCLLRACGGGGNRGDPRRESSQTRARFISSDSSTTKRRRRRDLSDRRSFRASLYHHAASPLGGPNI